MDDDFSAGDGGRKPRSLVEEAAELYKRVVPMPGTAAGERSGAVPDDLPRPSATGRGQPVPAPPRSPALIAPQSVAKVRAEPGGALAQSTPEAELTSLAPPMQEQTTPPTPVATAGPARPWPGRPRGSRRWPWIVLLLVLLAAAGAAALWVERPRMVPDVTLSVAPRSVTAEEPPPSPAAVEATAVPQLTAGSTETTPAQTPAVGSPTPTADPVAPSSSPSVDTAVGAPAAGPAEASSEPRLAAPLAAPDATTPGPQGSAGPADTTPESTSADPALSTSEPSPALAPSPAGAPPTATAEPQPETPAAADAAPTWRDWRVVIYFLSDSSQASAWAERLAAGLGPLTARVGTARADAVPRLPSVLYFHPEDAAAAQELATLLGRSAADAEWRVRAMPPPRTRRPPGTFEVWLPDAL